MSGAPPVHTALSAFLCKERKWVNPQDKETFYIVFSTQAILDVFLKDFDKDKAEYFYNIFNQHAHSHAFDEDQLGLALLVCRFATLGSDVVRETKKEITYCYAIRNAFTHIVSELCPGPCHVPAWFYETTLIEEHNQSNENFKELVRMQNRYMKEYKMALENERQVRKAEAQLQIQQEQEPTPSPSESPLH